MVRLLGFLVVAFNAWMLVDAYRRKAESYWLWIIVGVPGGSLAYFFMVKLRDRGMQHLGRQLLTSFRRPPSLDVLRRKREGSPSFANRLTLAQGLTDAGQYAEAREHFLALQGERPQDYDALFGLGVCELELGRGEQAAEVLSKLVELAPTYREYAAWPELSQALRRLGRTDESLELMEQLVRRAPRLSHQVYLAQHLRWAGRGSEARALLERGLREYDEAARHVRRDYRAAAREARRLLSEIGSGSDPPDAEDRR